MNAHWQAAGEFVVGQGVPQNLKQEKQN